MKRVIVCLIISVFLISSVSALGVGFIQIIEVYPGQDFEAAFSLQNLPPIGFDFLFIGSVLEGEQYISFPSGVEFLVPDGQIVHAPFRISVPLDAVVGDEYIVSLLWSPCCGISFKIRVIPPPPGVDSDGDGIPDIDDACPFENPEGKDADGDGCIDTIESLINVTEGLNLQQGISNSLDAKLQKAQDALIDLNENNDQSAIKKLEALVKEVEAQSGNLLTIEQADLLIAMVNNILLLL